MEEKIKSKSTDKKNKTKIIEKKGKTIKKVFKDAFTLTNDAETSTKLKEAVEEGAELKGANLSILIIAIIIASVGLNMNSTPVVIGAMLISPLMGGIIAMGYGIATGKYKIARNGLITFLIQMAISIVTSTIYFKVSPISSTCSELLQRTHPTIWDAIVALCCGFAAVIAMTRKNKVSNILPGVAIASALMPPLCTAGYGIARNNMQYFLGAMYLYFINSFFICIATIIIIQIMHYPKTRNYEKKKKRIATEFFILSILIIIPSIFIAKDMVEEKILEENVNKYLISEFEFDNTKIVNSKFNIDNKELDVILIGDKVSNDKINELENKLEKYGLQNIDLVITQSSINDSLTKEAIEALIDNKLNGNSGVKATITDDLKEQKNNESSNKNINQVTTENIDYASIKEQLKIFCPEIIECSVGKQDKAISSSTENTKIGVCIIKISNPIDDNTKNKILEFLKIALKVNEVQIFIE